jgi:hypothetical protein
MKVIIVESNQTIEDLVIQEYGHFDGIAQLFNDNPDLSFDTEPQPGTKLLIDETKIIDPIVVNYLKNKNIKLATYSADLEESHSSFSGGFSLGFK